MFPARVLTHAVLYAREAERPRRFYEDAFGFEIVAEIPGKAAFLRSAGTDNHHDLGLFAVGAGAPSPAPGAVGLYHLAWEVPAITDLVTAPETLQRLDALVGESDHG